MSNLSKTLLVASLLSVPLFAANASDGGPLGAKMTPAEIAKSMGGNGEAIYYATTTSEDTLKIVFPDGDNVIKPGSIELTKVNGVYEFPRSATVPFVPYKVINTEGYYPDPTQIDKVASKIAAEHKAYAFHINSIEENTKGSNTQLQISLYKQNTPLYYNSAIYHVYNGKTIRELTMESANSMKPMGKLKFDGSFPVSYDVTAEAAKLAIEKGASAFYITSIADNTQGTHQTVYVNYYK